MRLDVIIPTYNRADLLPRTLRSLLDARVPAGLEVRVVVVDNNSTDRTRAVVEEWASRFDMRLVYLFEAKQGRSPAINAGIRATDGDIVGLIDDDEEVDTGWYECAHRMFGSGDTDFIGGPCVPRWAKNSPEWFPSDYSGVIGWVDGGNKTVPFDDDYPGILMGGNSILTRSMLEKVGLYSDALGRTDKALLSCEDEDLYRRLQDSGARGFYCPELIIHHYVPPERLTKSYFRRWCFWRGVSKGLIDREHKQPITYFAGVPRFLLGRATRAVLRKGKDVCTGPHDPRRQFSDELAVWDLAGFFYGKHFYRARAAPGKSSNSPDQLSGQRKADLKALRTS